MPVFDTVPPVVASAKAWVSRSSSFHSTPPWAVAVRAAGSTRMPFIGLRSMTIPPSLVPYPGALCPPPRTDTTKPCSTANASARWTSATPRQRAIRAGRRSMLPFHTRRAAS